MVFIRGQIAQQGCFDVSSAIQEILNLYLEQKIHVIAERWDNTAHATNLLVLLEIMYMKSTLEVPSNTKACRILKHYTFLKVPLPSAFIPGITCLLIQ